MSEEIKVAVETAAPKSTPSMADAMPRSPDTSPSRAPEDSAGGGTSKTEREVYLEGELKKTIEARDLAKKRFLDSPEGVELLAKARKAEEVERAQVDAERKAAEERGEWKRLHDEEKSRREKLESEITESRRRSQLDAIRHEALDAYRDGSGIDAETFGLHLDKALADGSVKIGEDGKPDGIREFVKRLAEGKPFLFASQQEALRRVTEGVGNTLRAASTALGERKLDNAPRRRASLAEPNIDNRSMERALAARQNTSILPQK